MTGSVSSSEADVLKRRRSVVVGAVLIGGLIGALLTLLAGDFERRLVFDTWQREAPREISTDNVAVVLVDDYSVERIGEWPWPRFRMGELIGKIGQAEPAAIGLDIYFTQPDPLRPEAFAVNYFDDELDPQTRARVLQLPNWDEYLAAIIGQTPTVMARAAMKTGGSDPDELFFSSEVVGDAPPGILTTDRVLASITELDGAALSQGFVNGAPDNDGVVRRVPLSVKVGGTQMPGFAIELAKTAQDIDSLRWEGQTMNAGDLALPSDETATLQFKMGEIPLEAIHPAIEIIENETPAEELAGKVVIVGVGATGTFDIVATPLGSEILGPLVQAQAVDAILERQWLSRPASMVTAEIVAALVLLLLLVAAAFTFNNWFWVPALGLGLALPVVSFMAYDQSNLLFDPVRPLLVGVCAAIALWVTRYALARAERARLAAELVEERVRASEQKGELEAARRIQMSMVPGEKVLSRLDDRVEIGAVLEPAKSVGGDFFDAVKINDNQLLFLIGDVTGKGVPAALFMALSKTLSKSNLARAGDGLNVAVEALNRDLMDEADEEMGLTMLVGLIDCSTGQTELVNAGHENPLLVHADGSVETFEMVGGPPFCVIEFPYSGEPLQLAKGDTLVIITDGATEASNEREDLFGVEGVVSALAADDGASAPGRASRLAGQVRQFEGTNDPTDDLTIFALRYIGETAS